MIRSSRKSRWTLLGTLVVAAAAALVLPGTGPIRAQQTAAQKPLPEGYMRQGPVQPGLAPKMTYEEKTAAAHVFEVRFSTGDEILSGLYDLVAKHHITSGHITGIGGLAPGALLGWGDPDVGGFKKIEIKDKTEIVSLIGDISMRNDAPYVHVHMIVGSADGSTKAGHLIEAHIAPVGELTVVATTLAAH
jgi:predicted DNA-binding protein with PD1-like motif